MRRDIGRPERLHITSQSENAWRAARIVMGDRVDTPGDNLEPLPDA